MPPELAQSEPARLEAVLSEGARSEAARTQAALSRAEHEGRIASAAEVAATHPQDRVYSGVFGNGRVVALLKNSDGYAFGQRIVFENGVEANLLIAELAPRH